MTFRSISRAVVGTIALLAFVSPASAITYTTAYDSYSDASGGNQWEAYSLGYAVESGVLYYQLITQFQFDNQTGQDSYANTPLRGGDLYINVNGSHNANTGSVYGIGLSNHSGDQTADPKDNVYPWSAVQFGHLYSSAVFATGTWEGYAGADELSEDGGLDPFGTQNNLPTLIAGYNADLGATTTSLSVLPGLTQINPDGTTRSNVTRVTGQIALSLLGIGAGSTFELWWAPECGNDVVHTNSLVPNDTSVPEPASMALLALGLSGCFAMKRRRPLA